MIEANFHQYTRGTPPIYACHLDQNPNKEGYRQCVCRECLTRGIY